MQKDDVIYRQAAIDAVKRKTFRLTFAEEQNCEGHVAWSADAVYSDVMEGELLELPPAQPEQRWILCSERQPDVNGWYITTISGEICGQDRAFSGMSEFANGKWMSGDDVDETEMTIAWMPLPEPYKEGETT